ncbi:MAG: PAS domain S-box protein, partial [Gammaproteobacteria bacterium]
MSEANAGLLPVAADPAGAEAIRRQLRESEQQFRMLAESVGGAIFVHREDILYVNRLATELTGFSRGELVGSSLLDHVHPDHRDTVRNRIHGRMRGENRPARYEVRMLRRGGGEFWADVSGAMIDYHGKPAVLGTAFDVTHRKRIEDALFHEKERAEVTLESIADGVLVTDLRGRVQYLNRVAEGLTEMRRDRARGRRAGSVVRLVNEVTGKLLPDPVAACLHERRSVSVSGLAMLGGQINQHPHFIRAHASPVRDRGGAVVGVVLVLHDLTELQGPSGNTDHQTSHDALTGLCNRRGFSERLDAALESVRRGGRTHVLACLDMDRFKLVNETSGREAGDALIREVADLLGAHVGSLDLVGRMGS